MKEDYNIDKLFREKLEGFSEKPPAFVWDGIREQMAHGRRKKRTLWYRWTAVAALIALAFLAGWYFNETNNAGTPEVAETEWSEPERINESQSADQPAGVPLEGKDVGSGRLEDAYLANAGDSNIAQKGRKTDKEVPEGDDPAIMASARNPVEKLERLEPVEAQLFAQNNTTAEAGEKASLFGTMEMAYAYGEEEAVSPAENRLSEIEMETISRNAIAYASTDKKESGWRMGVNLSPGYSSYRAKHGTAYADNMTHEASDGNANMSGGISVRYKAAKRLSIESGMYYAQNGQQTGSSPQLFGRRPQSDAVSLTAEQLFFNTRVKMESSHLAMNSTAGVIAIDNMPAGAELAANLENTFTDGQSLITEGELSQVFDLVEIPVYLRYLILESVLDVELVGGINAGMVVGNNAYLDNAYGVQKIGRTRDISKVNLAGTFGVGVNYALGKQFTLAVEPRFNYYLNSISKNPEVDFRPYRIGIYTGLYYNF